MYNEQGGEKVVTTSYIYQFGVWIDTKSCSLEAVLNGIIQTHLTDYLLTELTLSKQLAERFYVDDFTGGAETWKKLLLSMRRLKN